MKKIYIASTLDNAVRVRKIRDVFKTHGIELTYDWTNHNDGLSIYIPDDDPELKELTAKKELRGVYDASAVLVVMPGGRGTHFEFGAAYVFKKPVVLLLDEHTGNSPAFHYLPSLIKLQSEAQAIEKVVDIVYNGLKLDGPHFIDELLGEIA